MAFLIPIAAAALSAISSNAQAKAANKNNDNQNAKAVEVQRDATNAANARVAAYMQSQRPHFQMGAKPAGLSPIGLMASARGGPVGSVLAPTSGAPAAPPQPVSGGVDPRFMQFIQMMMAHNWQGPNVTPVERGGIGAPAGSVARSMNFGDATTNTPAFHAATPYRSPIAARMQGAGLSPETLMRALGARVMR